MKLKGWKYGVWAILLSELMAFGENNFSTWAVAGVILGVALLSFVLRKSLKWHAAKLEFRKANPLSPVLFSALLLLLTVVAIVMPYLSGEVSYPLFLFVGILWLD